MSVATQPIYLGKIRDQGGLLTVANTNRDGTGTMVDLFVADTTNGSRVSKLVLFQGGPISVAPSNNVIRIWIKASATYRILSEVAIASPGTPSATAAGTSSVTIMNQDLAAGETLALSIHTVAGTQDNWYAIATGGDYTAS